MKPLLFILLLFGAHLIKLLDSVCQNQFSLYIISVYVPVVWYTEADGTKTASVMVKDPNTHKNDLQTPKIIRQYKPCSSKGSSPNCVLLCSVANAPDATLTMYNGSTVFSMNKYADLNIDLSLCLEVENQDKNTYSCVINNPLSNKTKDLNISQQCQPCKDLSQTPVSVMEGDSVTLPTNITEVKMEDHLAWMFECLHGQLTLIVDIIKKAASVFDCDHLRSRDRLQLDSQTGSLTIKNTSKKDSGIYKLLINSADSRCWSFNVSIHEPLPSPQISNHSKHCPSSDSECVLECSVENVSDVTLSWYKGNSSLSSISVSDLNYLCLDLDYKDNGNYSCVVSNSFISETKYLIIGELCSVQSNNRILIICVSVAVVVIALILGLCFYKRKQGRQEEAATSQNSPQETSSNTDRSAENEQQRLIDSSSSTDTSQSIPMCCR